MTTIQSTSDFITVNVTNSKSDHVGFERKFDKSLKVADLKVYKNFIIEYNYLLINNF